MQILGKFVKVLLICFVAIYCLMSSVDSFATVFNFPDPPNLAVAPFVMSDFADSLSVNSGNMAASIGGFTVRASNSSGTVTVAPGATLSYTALGDALRIDGSTNNNYPINVTNSGIISSLGNAILLSYRGTFPPAIVNNNGIITGAFTVVPSGATLVNLYIDTTSAQVNGAIDGALSLDLIFGRTTAVNFTTNGTISNLKDLLVERGTLTVSNDISGISTTFTTSSGTTTILNSSVIGAANTTNSGTMFIGSAGSLGTGGIFTNANKLNISSAFTVGTYSSFVNTGGALHVIGSGSITGNLTAGTSLNIGQDSTGAANSCAFTTGGTIAGIPIIHVFNGSFTANNAVSGVNTSFTVDSGAAATFNAAISGSGAITNAGTMTLGTASSLTTFSGLNNTETLSVTGATTNNINITNNGSMSIAANVAGAGTITNASNKTLTLSSGTVSNAITNNGTFLVTGASGTASINNTGTTTVTGALTNSGNIINSGTMTVNADITNGGSFNTSNIFTLAANLSMAGQTFTGSGSTTISGQRSITAANYNHSGTEYFTVSSSSVYDQLTCVGCAVNLSSGIVDISANFILAPAQNFTYTLLSGATLTPPSASNIHTHTMSTFDVMDVTTTSTSIIVNLHNTFLFAPLASSGINAKIAAVLDQMALDQPLNAQQTELLIAMAANTTSASMNDALHKLIPNFNSVDANVVFQNDTFKRIEQRVAALRDGYFGPSKDTYIAGDIDYCNSMWISAFAGHTKQLSISENDGYKANSLGTLLGYDSKISPDSALGFAVGMSGSEIDEYSNSGFYTDVFRYHALIYGAHNPIGSSFFDWVLSGSKNNNRGVRPIFISGVDMSTSSDYNSTLISGKMTFSSSFDCGPVTRFTPLTTVQFTNINQPTYTESGGVAALNVDSQSESIFTVGAGARFNFPINQWPCTAMRELRFLVSYDAIVGTNDATANFVAGSNSFTVANPLSKLAVSMGAGLTFELADHLQFQANYDVQLRKRFLDQVAMLKLRYLM